MIPTIRAYPAVSARPRNTDLQLALGLLANYILCFMAGPALADPSEDNCKSARVEIREQLLKKLTDVDEATITSLDTLNHTTSTGPDGEMPGYVCWATVSVRNKRSNINGVRKVIYTVFNATGVQGLPVGYSIVGISYVCGESQQWDRIYPPCRN
jgi:hypothetical protein